MYRRSPLRSTMNTNVVKASGMCKVCTEAVHSVARSTKTGGINLWTRKRKNAKTRKRRKRRKRRKPENAKTAKTAKTRKRENGENPKTAKTPKPENGESRKAVFASSNMLQSIKLAIKDARRWEQRETRKRPKARFLVFWFSRFLVFSFRWPHPSGQVAFFMCLGFFQVLLLASSAQIWALVSLGS